ncbi:MAG: glycosyltransferase family 2 protein [Candidatus Aureabacteria bacterium]|nr:glycosyltransferase family 2 protein [Candidatus Auribacterota bacterium]
MGITTSGAQGNGPPLVYVVLLNWNGMEHLPVCLASLTRQTYPNLRIVMVDNGSTDGSGEFSKECCPGIAVLSNKKNLGFAKANNQGLRYAAEHGAAYAVILNNDTECEPDFVSEMVRVAESDETIAACAPKILYFATRDILNGVGTDVSLFGYGWDRGAGEKDEGQYDSECDVFGSSGGAMLLRLSVIRKLGAFDPTYFIYFEDIDLSWRIRAFGYRTVAVPRAVVYHKFSATMGKTLLLKEFLSQKNRIRGVLKNFESRTLLKILPRMLLCDCKRIKYQLIDEGDSDSLKRGTVLIGAYLWNLLHLPSLLRYRHRMSQGRALSDEEMMKFLTPVMGGSTAVIPNYRLVNKELFARDPSTTKEIVMGDNDIGSLGAGWGNLHDLAGGRGKARRASKKSFFYFAGGMSTDHTLEMAILGTPSAQINGSVHVNGIPVGTYSAPPKSGFTIALRIPSKIAHNPVLECCIICDQIWVPDELYRNGDCRRVGVSVSRVSLHPLT